MSIWRRSQALLPAGVYDEVVSEALEARLAGLERTHAIEVAEVRKESDVDEQLVTLVRDAARIAIGSRADAREKIAVARELLGRLGKDSSFRPGEAVLRERILRSVAVRAQGQATAAPTPPRGSLLSSGLITNAHGESVLSHLASEFGSADRIDVLCSFIKLSGLDKFRPLIERHRALGRPLRVLTTTYMRATEVKAIELLHRLGAEVRVSYDDASTRLHAKSWLFHRDTEYSTAYVGSSNLSHAAQTEGLEWNVRIAQADQPDLFDEMRAVFETYWVDADRFEPFDGTEASTRRLVRALSEPERATGFFAFDLEPKEWQKPILRELQDARAAGRSRNLVVAATGTGKTLVAAFDYEQLLRAGRVDTLLFVAHRKEILEQSRRVFRHVLRREHFGELWVDGERPEAGRHVFASIQSLAQATDLPPDAFDHVIVDEVHHAAAASYVELLERLRPKELVGLTATPERADGRVYEGHFPRPYVGNLRVWDAIQQQVLVPFRYFVLDVEGLDLSDAKWNGGYVDSDLSQRLIRAQDLWVHSVTRAISERIARPEEVRALAFCVDKAHARVAADRLSALGLAARALTDETPRDERDRAKGDLTSGKVRVLCVVDLFNEGVDIPDVNTLFLFRPTESTTVFLQQLGRGLRRSRSKDILTVLDVTGRQHPSFRFDVICASSSVTRLASSGSSSRRASAGFPPVVCSSSRSVPRRTFSSGSGAPSLRPATACERSSRHIATRDGTSRRSWRRPRWTRSTSIGGVARGRRCERRSGSRNCRSTRASAKASRTSRSCCTSATATASKRGAASSRSSDQRAASSVASRPCCSSSCTAASRRLASTSSSPAGLHMKRCGRSSGNSSRS